MTVDEQPAPAAARTAFRSTLPRLERPSGEKAPLPKAVSVAERWALGVAAVATSVWLAAVWTRHGAGPPTAIDAALVRFATRHRSDAITDVARFVLGIERDGIADLLTVVVIAGLAVSRRLRRLLVFAVALVVTQLLVTRLQHFVDWPRPFDTVRTTRWEGYGGLSYATAHLTVVSLGVTYGLVALRRRALALSIVAVIVGLFAVASVSSGVADPSDTLGAAGLAALITLGLFLVFCPDTVFPVQRRRGPTAHLELTDERVALIEEAVAEQLGLRVLDIEPFGGSSSGGSTPVRLLVDSDPPVYVFGKLFTQQHLVSDRMYKLVRSLLYGRLEDESPYGTVRALAQSEDYHLRVLRDAGAPVLDTYGVVEVLAEREYLLVTMYANDSVELTEVEPPISDEVIDQALAAIRVMWDNGAAHRDVKPANVLLQGERVFVIDCGFAQIHPSPWRQAVDLANMMLSLALKSSSTRVYDRTVTMFSPDDVAEAFAATGGVTIPTQLQSLLSDDDRDLVEEFRALAPPRDPVPVQHWSLRRVALIVATLVAASALALGALTAFVWQDRGRIATPYCTSGAPLQLVAQSLPNADQVPCVSALAAGWHVTLSRVDDDGARLRFSAPDRALTFAFSHRCAPVRRVRTAARLRIGGDDVVLWSQRARSPGASSARYLFEWGGVCTALTAQSPQPARRSASTVSADARRLVRWMPRAFLDAVVEANTHGRAHHV
jgi:hypothetical protein